MFICNIGDRIYLEFDGEKIKKYCCNYCSGIVMSNKCFYCIHYSQIVWQIYVCPNCNQPTIFIDDKQIPGVKIGKNFKKLPNDIKLMYEEIKNCYAVNAFNAIGLLSRTLLQRICINLSKEDKKNLSEKLSFQEYVEWLDKENYIGKNIHSRVDKLREIGNKIAHESFDISSKEAKNVLEYLEIVLLIIYEFKEDQK